MTELYIAAALGVGFIGLLVWAFLRGERYGVAQEENEGYEAESKARAKFRRIADRAKRDWMRHHDKG